MSLSADVFFRGSRRPPGDGLRRFSHIDRFRRSEVDGYLGWKGILKLSVEISAKQDAPIFPPRWHLHKRKIKFEPRSPPERLNK